MFNGLKELIKLPSMLSDVFRPLSHVIGYVLKLRMCLIRLWMISWKHSPNGHALIMRSWDWCGLSCGVWNAVIGRNFFRWWYLQISLGKVYLKWLLRPFCEKYHLRWGNCKLVRDSCQESVKCFLLSLEWEKVVIAMGFLPPLFQLHL